MKTKKTALLLTLLTSALCSASSLHADPETKPATPPPLKAESAAATERSKRVSEASPATHATATVPTQTEAVSTPPPTRSGDNDAVVLAPIVVESPASPTPAEVATPKEAGAAAREKHFKGELNRGLNTHTLPLVGNTPEERALDTEREEKRAETINDTKRMVTLAQSEGSPEAATLKDELHEVSTRDNFIENTTPSTLRRD